MPAAMPDPVCTPTSAAARNRCRATRTALGVAAVIMVAAVLAYVRPDAVRGSVYTALAPLRDALAARYPRQSLPMGRHLHGIVMLGGHWSRVAPAVELAKANSSARLIVTGASPREQALLARADIDSARVLYEPDARSTYENATHLKAVLAPRPGQSFVLITSAVHMPRAMATFEQAGFDVIPWPVDDSHPAPRYTGEVVAHELLGLAYYRLLGRTHTLWPGAKTETR